MLHFSLIVAEEASTHGIGLNGKIPWYIKQDLDFFKRITTETQNSVVIMGRKTWESLPDSRRPLPNRINVVVSPTLFEKSKQQQLEKEASYGDNVHFCADIKSVWSLLSSLICKKTTLGKIFVIGGSRLFNECVQSPWCEQVYLTQVFRAKKYECDTFWTGIPEADYTKTECLEKYQIDNNSEHVEITLWKRTRVAVHPETGYLELVKKVLDEGVTRTDRTGVGTISIFGAQLRFDLSAGLPLFTTKSVFWRAVREELLWFIAAETDSFTLSQKGIHIWDDNGTRSFLDKQGLHHHREGDLGPVYGFQWRHFGAKYEGPISKDNPGQYVGKGVDQLRQCIDMIKHNPDSRRIIMSAWNPLDLNDMALPPCHVMCQFYVCNGKLSCQLYQRSADLMLGVPFNVASYALLTQMIAHCCQLQVGEFIHTMGDAHIYLNHVDGAKEQVQRRPVAFPTVKINALKKDIDEITGDDITLQNYVSHPKINFQMAV
jgi:dihydrofolate reductase/thymidylate synthase